MKKGISCLLLFASLAAVSSAAHAAEEIPLKYIQIRCNADDKSEIAAIGNDSETEATETEAILYTRNGRKYVAGSAEKAEITYGQNGMHTGISVKSASVDIELNVFKYPLQWTNGTMNGKSAQCVIDPVYFGSIPFGN